VTARVLVTRALDQSRALADALLDHGLEPVVVPAVEIAIDPPGGPLDAAARSLATFDWVAVTSPNGARAIITAVARVSAALGAPAWAAIGAGTAAVLEVAGIRNVFRPRRPDRHALASELPIRRGQRVLVPRSDVAGDGLGARLRERGAETTDVVAYRTIEAPPSSRPALRDAFRPGPPAAVVLASGSAARGLLALATAEGLDVVTIPAICIGPETAAEASRLGFEIRATAPGPDARTVASTTAAALAVPEGTR